MDIRGRSRTLRVNYRTSHQIRTQADRLLGPAVTDVDGNIDNRNDTVSVFNGPLPTIYSLKSESEEIETVGKWIAEHAKSGLLPHEFGVFVRSETQLDRARAAAKEAGLTFKVLDEHVETTSGHHSIGTMHLAKGLEFRAVAVMACDDEIISLQERIETVGDDADLQEVYDTERHLLYVACTRARSPAGDWSRPRLFGRLRSEQIADVLISDSTAGPVGQPLRPFHRRDALPRGTFNDGADGGDDAEEGKRAGSTQATPAPALG